MRTDAGICDIFDVAVRGNDAFGIKNEELFIDNEELFIANEWIPQATGLPVFAPRGSVASDGSMLA